MLEEVIDIPFPGTLGKILMTWNVRVVILYSLLLQIILFFGAPMRKRTGNRMVLLLIWSSYSSAELATNFALGQITSSQNSKHGENRDLYAFWASLILLLHHGGPDTKTAFEENENELWLRHLLTLISQAIPMFLIFLQTLPESQLWFPTSLILLAGIIKYAERACSLYSASWRTFQETMLKEPDPGPDYAKLMQKFSSMKVARLPTIMSQTVDATIKESKKAFYSTSQPDSTSQPRQDQKLDEFDVVKYAYEHFFKIFKGLVVDLVSQHDRQESRAFFLARRPEDALKVLEVEFNFIYEVLYTKFNVIHNLKGYFWRSVSSLLVLVSLGIFFFVDCKNGLGKFDIGVTYTLLLGALSLEAIALFKLIFSDRTAASLDKTKANPFVKTIFERYLKLKSPRWSRCKDESSMNVSGIDQSRTTSVLLRRWSESVAGFNLITYCLKQLPKNSHGENQWCLGIYKKTSHLLHCIQRTCPKNGFEPLGAQDFPDELNYASKNPFTKNLWNFIFCELQWKSRKENQLENIKTRSSARGAYVLEKYKKKHGGVSETLKTDYIENVTFDESLLLWHIATELCYHGSEVDHETEAQSDEQDFDYHGSEVDRYRKFMSKLISDYMLYLLVMKPTMMSAVAGIGQIRYRDTCADAQRFFLNEKLGPNTEKLDACKKLLDVNTDVKPVHVKGDKSKSVLFDACMLAKELQKLEGSKWKVISEVWVEMLAYASNHCKPDAHIEQVSRGGELINLVWLLMAHLGLADQFVFTTDFGPAKLIVEK